MLRTKSEHPDAATYSQKNTQVKLTKVVMLSDIFNKRQIKLQNRWWCSRLYYFLIKSGHDAQLLCKVMKTSISPECLKWNTFLLADFSFAAVTKKHPCPTKAQLNQLDLQNLGLDQTVFQQLLSTNNTWTVLLCRNFCLFTPDMAEEFLWIYIYTILSFKLYSYSFTKM